MKIKTQVKNKQLYNESRSVWPYQVHGCQQGTQTGNDWCLTGLDQCMHYHLTVVNKLNICRESISLTASKH